jgi:hypothetical protein
MTDNRYEHFRPMKSGKEYIAEAEAAADSTPPPHPDSLNFDPVETSPDQWQVPNDPRVYRTRDEARRAGLTARAKADRAYANYVNALPVPTKTAGQEVAEDYEAAKARALSEGVAPELWDNSPEVRAAYLPDNRTGAQLWEEYKRTKHTI